MKQPRGVFRKLKAGDPITVNGVEYKFLQKSVFRGYCVAFDVLGHEWLVSYDEISLPEPDEKPIPRAAPEPQAGQFVYLAPVSKHLRQEGGEILEGTITVMGRKYITVKAGGRIYQFDKDTLWQHSKYSPDYRLYLNKQDMADAQEREAALRKINRIFGDPKELRKLSLEQARRVRDIVEA